MKKDKKTDTLKENKISRVPEYKKKIVSDLIDKIKNSKTVLIASTKGLPGSQFHQIKKKLRGKVEIVVAKKKLLLRAIAGIDKGALQNLKEKIGADVALFFSDINAFELSSLLTENQSPVRAKAGDIAPEDIHIEPGPTDLIPGPAISELSGVGLKVAVENGKLAIKQPHVIVKKGEKINSKVAGVLGKLGITPLKVGFLPIGAYSATDDKVYFDIKIDKHAILESLREAIGKSFGFSVNIKYVNKSNIGFFITKAGAEGKALEKIIESKFNTQEEKKEDVKENKTDSNEENNVNIESDNRTDDTKINVKDKNISDKTQKTKREEKQ